MKSKILYIDDVKENRDSFKLSFWTKYDVLLADNLEDAKHILKAGSVKVVFIDQKVLDETGTTFIDEIRTCCPDVIIILTTAFVSLDLALNAIKMGAYQLLQKPLEEKEILQVLKNAVEKYDLEKKNKDLLVELYEKNLQLEASNNELFMLTGELKKSKDNVEKKEKLLMDIFKSLPFIMLLIDSKKQIAKINKTGVDISGKSMDEIIGTGGGGALNCINALSNPEGCGAAHDCKKCVIRNTVTNSLELKKNYQKVKTTFSMATEEGVSERQVLLSTTYIDREEPMVLVTIEDTGEIKSYPVSEEKTAFHKKIMQ